MLIQKSFFRKKSTKLYMLMLTIIFMIIIIFMSCINYCQKTSSEINLRNNIYYMISKDNYLKKLKKVNDINDIKEGIILEYVNKDPVIDDNKKSNFTWSEIAIIHDNKQLFIFDTDSKLVKNEISITCNNKDTNLENLIGEKINLIYNDEEINLFIKNAEYGKIPNITVSNDLFSKLYKQRKMNVYKLLPKNKNILSKLENKLKVSEDNSDFVLGQTSFYENSEDEEIKNEQYYINLINTLSIIAIILIIFFILIFIVLTSNIINDELFLNNIRRFLGYEKRILLLNTIINFIILTLISFVIAVILSEILCLIVNNLYQIDLTLMSIDKISVVYLLSLLITCLLCFFKALMSVLRGS